MADNDVYTYEYFLQEDVCRLCWNRNANTELFYENYGNTTEISLVEIIKDCFNIELTTINPSKVCASCCNKVKRFYSYKKLCQENNEKLQEIMYKGLSEMKNNDNDASVIKEEVIGDHVDDKIDYLDDEDDYETSTVKTPLSHSKFRKKFMLKLSPTYCSLCCIDLESKEALSQHNSVNHGIENDGTLFKCFGCEKRFKSRKTRKSHEINFCKGLKDGYKCTLCDRYLPKRSMYEYHMRDHRHNTLTELPEHIFKCRKCSVSFKTNELLKTHMLEHIIQKNYVCDINFCKGLKDGYKCTLCDRYLPKRSMYEYHMRDHRHNTLTELPEHIFKCRKCSVSFKTNELLKTHMLEHIIQKNYVCDICGRVFTRQDYLHKHKLTHAGIKRHSCPHCDFKAIQRSSLTTHIRKHTGERPYSCDMCPQKCISSSNLRAHKRRHLGDKKYECTICNKKFGYKISLEEHVSSTHVRSETYPCEHCGATYTRVRGLKRHLAAKHGKQDKNKNGEQKIIVEVTEDSTNKMHVEFELKDGENVLLLKHQDGNVYIE